MGELKEQLGIANKSDEVVALEDEALALRRAPLRNRPAGKTGPDPSGGMSFAEIGKKLKHSERWAALAVKAAER